MSSSCEVRGGEIHFVESFYVGCFEIESKLSGEFKMRDMLVESFVEEVWDGFFNGKVVVNIEFGGDWIVRGIRGGFLGHKGTKSYEDYNF